MLNDDFDFKRTNDFLNLRWQLLGAFLIKEKQEESAE